MFPELSDVSNVLEELAPIAYAEEWDNPGLQVGQPSQVIHNIFIALDPTLEALKAASEINAQLLLTHHPLLFKPLHHLDLTTAPGKIILEAVHSGIAIVAAHTNLDVARGGINDMLAQVFSLRDIAPLQERTDLDDRGVGLGRIGLLPQSETLDEIAENVKGTWGLRTVKVVGEKNRLINRVAVVGGSGGGLVSTAAKAGAELLITGDIGHHHALEAVARGLALIDAGHFHTEKRALSLFAEPFETALRKRGYDVAVAFFENEKCPERYL